MKEEVRPIATVVLAVVVYLLALALLGGVGGWLLGAAL
jgi:hypothetical protein